MAFLDTTGAQLAYECHDSVSPWISLVHGGLVGSPSWRSQLPTKTNPNLTRAGSILCHDQRGYGASTGAGHGDFGVMADGEMKNGITESVFEPAPPVTPMLGSQASQV